MISENNFIDTKSSESIEKYKRNLEYLISQAREKNKIDKFVIIRSDDFFPDDYLWRPNSKYTNYEFRTLVNLCKYSTIPSGRKGFISSIFKRKEVISEHSEIETISLCYPVKFRSTKHFTINTALKLTSSYNAVKLDRDFTIIDNIDNFLCSGYGYSLSAYDAYLDVTHEPLKISDNAIVLISSDKFLELKNDQELMDKILKRRLIVYDGDISDAINMILTENGILPINPGYEYDDGLHKIIEDSLKKLCIEYNLEYGRSHGFNGHFTSLIDQYDDDAEDVLNEFIIFLNNNQGFDVITRKQIQVLGNRAWVDCVEKIGYETFKKIVDVFNEKKKCEILANKEKYLNDRNNISPDVSSLFKEALRLIRLYEKEISFSNENDLITKHIIKFFLSPDLKEQVDAALNITGFFNNFYNQSIVSKKI